MIRILFACVLNVACLPDLWQMYFFLALDQNHILERNLFFFNMEMFVENI